MEILKGQTKSFSLIYFQNQIEISQENAEPAKNLVSIAKKSIGPILFPVGWIDSHLTFPRK